MVAGCNPYCKYITIAIMKTANEPSMVSRQTKYVEAVLLALDIYKHATNDQILGIVRQIYPEASATTVHRVTVRLKERGVIGVAPKTIDASERYDIDPTPHHHFMCIQCDRLCNVPENEQSRQAVELLGSMSKRCKFAGMVTLQGVCEICAEKE